MTDIKVRGTEPSLSLLYLREDELLEGMELLYFAYRDFTSGADEILKERSLGRAHHRAMHFIARRPGLTINELLQLLNIKKQSLGRVLRDLVDIGFVDQRRGETDRRQKLLTLTNEGAAFERRLAGALKTAMMDAYRSAGQEAVAGFRKVLKGLAHPETRALSEKMSEHKK